MITKTIALDVCSTVAAWRKSKRLTRPEGYWDRILRIDGDAKTRKGVKRGHLTGILYLAPANMSGVLNTCSCASGGCMDVCLVTSGRAGFDPRINLTRIAKTRYMVESMKAFLLSIAHDILGLIRTAKRRRLKPAVRLNGTSDLPWLALFFAQLFPEVQFYDYTKIPRAWTRTLPNYHLTFSHSETNYAHCMDALAHGLSVAVVFGLKKGAPMPATWNGFPVFNGDIDDLRFLDPKGAVVGLYAKGRAKKDQSGFVVRSGLIQIGVAA